MDVDEIAGHGRLSLWQGIGHGAPGWINQVNSVLVGMFILATVTFVVGLIILLVRGSESKVGVLAIGALNTIAKLSLLVGGISFCFVILPEGLPPPDELMFLCLIGAATLLLSFMVAFAAVSLRAVLRVIQILKRNAPVSGL